MPVFKDTQQMYDVLGTLFAKLGLDPVVGPKFYASNINIRFNMSDPDGTINLIHGKEGPELVCGPSDVKPDIEMDMAGDDAHRFWLRKLNLTVALATRKVKVRGPVPKLLKLLPLLKPAYENYPDLAREKGLPID